jgi:hypothetical protein
MARIEVFCVNVVYGIDKNERFLRCYAVVAVKMGSFATCEDNGGELADALFKLKSESGLELRCGSRLVLRSKVADERVDVDLRRHCNRSTGHFSMTIKRCQGQKRLR